ncbi:MAG: hypothetical protein ICV63_21120 [Coleofasciculus sp. Co-bin14]|nr:hypothetical protein [Coleofasciculus sp. Co-bin14]
MKIVEQTPNRLRLRANKLKGIVGMVLVGTLFLLGGLWVMLIFRTFLIGFAYFFGGILALVGAGLVFGSLLNAEFIVSCTFDKALGLVRLKQQTLRRTKVTEWRLREINQVEVKEHTDSYGEKTYSVWLNLSSGGHIPVSLQSITSQEGNQKMAECIRQFLNLKA